MLAADTDLWTDTTWVVDSTPIECARSREAAKRSELVGPDTATPPATPGSLGPPPAPDRHPSRPPDHLGPGNPKLDERQVLMAVLDHDPILLADRPSLLIIADKGSVSRELDTFLAAEHGCYARTTATAPHTYSTQSDN